ncbi:site-specific integrase [Vibrio anguillarum]|uniref:site-specific integrase n=1 Tax=Vibrio TaxID=662 RepID=UPI001023CCF0|nr:MULTISPECIES: site-specific integrase [Vibrio]MCC4236325.1 site-specific integrase [Vibrio anguillarum]MDT3846419.1 site-specific integrase [Vibrio anguillarum]RZP69393.1 site-specific integrase [Vibrio vulnificus]RZQ03680.1 site-specific integrase [Vibrio vulnificus]RZR20535.1 site-specific integrase [Vibrio vulnificus]
MSKIRYEIVTTDIKPFTYKTPLVNCDVNGELQVSYSRNPDNHVHIKRITFLNLVGRDRKGKVVFFEPMDYVNRFLMAQHIEDDKEESAQYSKGLVHYFSYLIDLQEAWDEEFDEDLFDELRDLPRPRWNFMPTRKSDRPTYMYQKAVKESVTGTVNPEFDLAKTTATAYVNAVVKFYSFYLRIGYRFNNPPFEYELVTIVYEGSSSSMAAYHSIDVHTTDLRLNFPKSKRNLGGSLPVSRRDLRPFSNTEWKEIENILINTKKVVKNVKGQKKVVKLAEEYCLFFLVGRFTGLRKEEVASLHLGQIVDADLNKPMLRLGVGDEYGSLTKTKDGGNKSRQTIIPSQIMKMLYDYTKSSRFKKRQDKFKALCKSKRDMGEIAFFDSVDGVDENKKYVFVSATGVPFFLKLNELNNRWGEVRYTASEVLSHDITGVIHNLRPTFAVALFRMLLKIKDADTALAIVSELLGHEDLSTTLLYLKIAQEDPSGDEIYEDVLDFLGVFDDVEDLEDQVLPSKGECNE